MLWILHEGHFIVSALTQKALDCMVEDISAHQTVVSGYIWEQEWEYVGTFTFFSVYICFVWIFGDENTFMYSLCRYFLKINCLKNTRDWIYKLEDIDIQEWLKTYI